ncbi:MAG: response regulator transcription factor [Flavobacteriales bacterium]|nr:response regulator transcription factor [Flavobacteriales bacterium]
MIKAIVVDDHQIFVDGVKALINSMKGIEVVGEANNGVDLIDCLSKTEANIILMDVNMPVMDGIEATKAVLEKYPNLKVLMLTMHGSKEYIEKLLKAGAHGYVLKNTGKAELQTAVETIMSGEAFYSAAVTKRIMESMQKKRVVEKRIGNVELTQRETEVIVLIAQEYTTNEIAERLFISHHTVESHRKNLISKLQVRGVSGLVKYAIQSDLVD